MKRLLAIFAVFVFVLSSFLSYPGSSSGIPRLDVDFPSRSGIIDKLTNIFRGLSEEQIDNAVEKAKRQLAAGQKQAKHENLEELFDSQITTLKSRGVPEQILNELQSKKSAVVDRARSTMIGKGNIPFLPVIKASHFGYSGLMSLVRNGAKEGRADLDPALITDKVKTPKYNYYIYDVEDGSSTRGKSPKNAENTFRWQKRFSLTLDEVVALATHTDVLSKHHVWATGSRYEYDDWVPSVDIDGGGRPELDWSHIDFSYGNLGSASRSSR